MPDNTRTVTERRVTPAAFAAWLHAQGQEPSTHVLAWFKHKGVAWPPVTASSGDAAPSSGPAVPMDRLDVKDFDTLCRYLAPYKGKDGSEWPSWETEWVGYVRGAVKAHDAVNGRGGKAAAGRALGMKSEGEGVAQLFKRYPEPKASPFPVPRSTSKAR